MNANRMNHGLRLALAAVVALSALGLSACGSDEGAKKDDASLEAKRREGPDEPWRKERPPAGPAPTVKLPEFKEQKLKSGLTVIVAEMPSLPIVDVRVAVKAGGALEKPAQAGLAAVTYDMLDEGAAGMDGAALSEAFAELGTRLRVGNDREGGGLAVSVLKRNLEPAAELLGKVVKKPSFDKQAFERVIQRRLSALVGRKGDPQTQAMETFAAAAYGAKHPYGHRANGTEESLQKLKVREAKKFWSQNAGPKNSALVFAGQITLDEAVALAEEVLGDWKGKAKPPRAPKEPKPVEGTDIFLVKGPAGAPQTVMYFGRPLLPRGHEDEIAVDVMNQVLGGMFSSRLNMNLREDKGWTYGAGSFFDGRKGKGPWLAGASVKAEHTAAAVKEFFAELGRMKSEPPSELELKLAKANLTKSLPGRFETVGASGGAAAELFLYDLPLDYYDSLSGKIDAVTAAEVVEVAEMATARQGLVGVLVGDPALAEAVRGLELGEVKVIEPGDNPRK